MDAEKMNEARKATEETPVPTPVVPVLGPDPRPGRRPKVEKTVDARLRQLVKESAAWRRLVREAWFDPASPLIEAAVGATERPDLPALYDEAIDVVREVAAYAEVAEKLLLKGREEAERKLGGKAATDAAKKPI